HAVLQGQRDRRGEAVHQPGDCRTFFRRGDEDLARSPVLVQPNCQITLIAPNIEMMDNSLSLVRPTPSNGLRCHRVLDISPRNTYKRNFGQADVSPTGLPQIEQAWSPTALASFHLLRGRRAQRSTRASRDDGEGGGNADQVVRVFTAAAIHRFRQRSRYGFKSRGHLQSFSSARVEGRRD